MVPKSLLPNHYIRHERMEDEGLYPMGKHVDKLIGIYENKSCCLTICSCKFIALIYWGESALKNICNYFLILHPPWAKPFPFLLGTIHNLMLLIIMPNNMTLHAGCQFRNRFCACKMETEVLKLVSHLFFMKSPFPLLMVFVWNFIFSCIGS